MKRRVAIAGLGAAARNIHIPALRKLSNVEIVGGCDPAATVAGIPQFATLDAMLSETRPDFLVIATPPGSHADLARAGIAAGCNIFCEKPLANSLEEADGLARLAQAAGLHVVVNSEYPFMPIHERARNEIGGPRFGELKFLDIRQSFVVSEATEAGWRGGDMQRTFKEFGTHAIDLCKFFFGERPLYLRSRMPKPGSPDGPDLLCIVELGFSDDRVALIVLDRLSKARHRYLEVRMVGERANIETSIGGRIRLSLGYDPKRRRPFADWDVAMGGVARLCRGESHEVLAKAPIDLFADATARLFSAYVRAVEEGRDPPNGIDEARNTLALLYGSYEAAAEGSPRACA